ncbi:MAG: hypothetical protein IJ381_08845 [Clostridia bacterium]|nr:hypothetical protein [Clostridia bacterium]
MMKKIPKTAKVILGIIKGVMSTMTMIQFLPGLENVAELLTMINCAFCITLFTAADEKDSCLSLVFLFWLITMTLTICPMTARFTVMGIMQGIGYAAAMLLAAYSIMRVRFLMTGIEYHSPEAQEMRYFLLDDLYRRFFGESIQDAIEREAHEDDSANA